MLSRSYDDSSTILTDWILDWKGLIKAFVEAVATLIQPPDTAELHPPSRWSWNNSSQFQFIHLVNRKKIPLQQHCSQCMFNTPRTTCFSGTTVINIAFSPSFLPSRPEIWTSFHLDFGIPKMNTLNGDVCVCVCPVYQDWLQWRAPAHPSPLNTRQCKIGDLHS